MARLKSTLSTQPPTRNASSARGLTNDRPSSGWINRRRLAVGIHQIQFQSHDIKPYFYSAAAGSSCVLKFNEEHCVVVGLRPSVGGFAAGQNEEPATDRM